MKKSSFMAWFREQVEPRWPGWQVNGAILSDWCVALGRYDEATLTEAIRRHKIRDDPAHPKISKVVSLARELHSAAIERAPRDESRRECVTVAQFWETVRTTFPRRQRMALMRQQIKFDPRARQRDPEAYDWVQQERDASAAAAQG